MNRYSVDCHLIERFVGASVHDVKVGLDEAGGKRRLLNLHDIDTIRRSGGGCESKPGDDEARLIADQGHAAWELLIAPAGGPKQTTTINCTERIFHSAVLVAERSGDICAVDAILTESDAKRRVAWLGS